MPGWTGAPQLVPARIVWRTELGQQLPGERKARRRAGEAAERSDLDGRPWEVPGEFFRRLDMQPLGCLN
jgi:hypothetical protein